DGWPKQQGEWRTITEPAADRTRDRSHHVVRHLIDEADALHGQVQPRLRYQREPWQLSKLALVVSDESVQLGPVLEGQVPGVELAVITPARPTPPVAADVVGMGSRGEVCVRHGVRPGTARRAVGLLAPRRTHRPA